MCPGGAFQTTFRSLVGVAGQRNATEQRVNGILSWWGRQPEGELSETFESSDSSGEICKIKINLHILSGQTVYFPITFPPLSGFVTRAESHDASTPHQ